MVRAHRVVPNIQVLREFAPLLKIVHECGIMAIVPCRKRMRETALDRTETRYHIVVRAHGLGSLARILVDERLGFHPWIPGSDLIRHAIYEV